MKGKNIVIGGAWPYANSSLHLGHIAGLISGDVLARYFRLTGNNVIYTSGSDTHGTPITERAKKEKTTPEEIAMKYHEEFDGMFKRLNFSYDLYSHTNTEFHCKKTQEIFKKLYDNGYIYEKIEPQAYCPNCNRFLADREITLTCPSCGEETKGDQCDNCLHVPTQEELMEGNCIDCGTKVVSKDNKNLYLKLSAFQKIVEDHTKEVKHEWRINAQNETEKYLKQGLLDRAVTRDLNWGVEIPIPGYDDKRMYVWIDAVLGYVTNTYRVCEERGWNFDDFWKQNDNNKIYMVHGKDNIVFHSIIFNALLAGMEENYRLVDTIVSSEYLNYNDQKFSKSKGIGITALKALDIYDCDSLRYYLIANGPEKKDTNFSPDDFINVHNGEILNKFGNLVNRTLKFKGLEEVPNGNMDKEIEEKVKATYVKVGDLIEKLEFREAIRTIIELIEDTNKYYDTEEPWKAKNEDINKFNDVIYTCSVVIANLSNLFEPIMPGATEKIRKYLQIDKPTWEYIEAKKGLKLENIEPLFERMTK